MNFFGEIWQSFRSTIRGFDSPHQLALGLTLGLMVGLLPKDSLLPYMLGTLAILTPGNLVCLALGVVVGSIAGPFCDTFTHEIGGWILTFAPLQSTWASLYKLPIVPWTRFENTVVMGSLALGVLAALPIYFVSKTTFKAFGPRAYAIVTDNRFTRRWLSTPQPQES